MSITDPRDVIEAEAARKRALADLEGQHATETKELESRLKKMEFWLKLLGTPGI